MTHSSYRTVVLRYGEHISPPEGTIAAHQKVIDELGYVWYGKLGVPLSAQKLERIRSQREDRSMSVFLLTKRDLTLVEVDECSATVAGSDLGAVPSYYRARHEDARTWFRVRRLTNVVAKGAAGHLLVESSRRPLSEVLSGSVSPMFYVSITSDYLELLSK